MLEKFYPDEYIKSAYVIDYQRLYKDGYRGILFDIDNTLVEHGADADDRAVELLERLKGMGFRICLLSNNSEKRVMRFKEKVMVEHISRANKPRRKNYYQAMKRLQLGTAQTVFIGDQLFTDVYGAKRSGIHCILVKPIAEKEEIQIIIKRFFEKKVLKEYRKRKTEYRQDSRDK